MMRICARRGRHVSRHGRPRGRCHRYRMHGPPFDLDGIARPAAAGWWFSLRAAMHIYEHQATSCRSSVVSLPSCTAAALRVACNPAVRETRRVSTARARALSSIACNYQMADGHCRHMCPMVCLELLCLRLFLLRRTACVLHVLVVWLMGFVAVLAAVPLCLGAGFAYCGACCVCLCWECGLWLQRNGCSERHSWPS